MADIFSSAGIENLVHTYGLWGLFALVMLESMGLPLPGETALIAEALYAGTNHHTSVMAIILVAAMAAVVGDNLGYLIGRSVGLRLLVRYGRYVRIGEDRLKLGKHLFRRHGGKIVFFGRFVALLRALAALLAGANRMPWPRFLVMNAAGGIVWATLFGGGSFLFGERMKSIAGPVSVTLLLVALVLVAIGLVYLKRYEQILLERAKASPQSGA